MSFRSAGLRTFPLVAVGACAFVLTGTAVLGAPDPLSRIVYGLIAGIGFIGGGVILKSEGNVTGTTTAAKRPDSRSSLRYDYGDSG